MTEYNSALAPFLVSFIRFKFQVVADHEVAGDEVAEAHRQIQHSSRHEGSYAGATHHLKWLAHCDWAASMYQPMIAKFWHCFWEGDFEKNGKRRFEEHYAHAKSLAPPARLLEYNVAEGWAPLCEFLDVPKPEVEFPRTNDANGFVVRCRWRMRMQMFNVLVRFILFFGLLIVVGGTLGSLASRAWSLYLIDEK